MPKVKTESIVSKMINTRANSFPNNSVPLSSIRNAQRTQPSSSPSRLDVLLQGLGAEPLFASVRNTTTQESKDSKNDSEVFNSLLNRLGQNQNPDLRLSINSQPLAPNPISILNELYQSLKSPEPPRYEYINEHYGFICKLEVFGKVYKSSIPRGRKQEAKEDAALIAVNDIKEHEDIADILSNDLLQVYEKEIQNTSDVTKTQAWYQKQEKEWPDKKPRVILLEFCQMHRLPPPKYIVRTDATGYLSYNCIIGDRIFNSESQLFPRANEAKDYIASKAFAILYEEYCEIERQQETALKNKFYGMQHSDASPTIVDRVLSNLEDNKCANTNAESITSTGVNSIVAPRLTNNIDKASLVLPSLDESSPKIKEEPLTTPMLIPQPQIKVMQSPSLEMPPPQSSPPSMISSPSSSKSFHPYRPSIHQNMIPVKKYISLLYELCQARQWKLPIFSMQNCVIGFIGTVSVNNHTFKGNAHAKKSEAKEDVAGVAYKFFTSDLE